LSRHIARPGGEYVNLHPISQESLCYLQELKGNIELRSRAQVMRLARILGPEDAKASI
jgi:hypothetical protein